MKAALFKMLFLLIIYYPIHTITAQEMTSEQVVQKSMESYNDRNIEAFMSVIDTDVTFHNFSNGSITMQGKAACRAFYNALFEASPNLKSTVLTRTVFGNKIIDHEYITGRNGSDEAIELVLIYEVESEKIVKVTVLRKES
ncbi:nuclear transport factor 2 family protein [Maribacter antarcticus]|uniref:nuclear transport factor 2 family protein n=1 Tax=Maribacter antarcticus TaxID=505250 RepID=UPI00047BE4AD|nr:nuclear transport factor 2 family protein [Maribacter antarcticus]